MISGNSFARRRACPDPDPGRAAILVRVHQRLISSLRLCVFAVSLAFAIALVASEPDHPALSHRQVSFSSAAVFPTVARQACSLPGGIETAMRVV